MLIHHDYGIGSEYHIVGVPREDGAGLIARQALRVLQWWFVGKWLLGNMGGFRGERNASISQKLGPAWRSGSQDKGHAGTILQAADKPEPVEELAFRPASKSSIDLRPRTSVRESDTYSWRASLVDLGIHRGTRRQNSSYSPSNRARSARLVEDREQMKAHRQRCSIHGQQPILVEDRLSENRGQHRAVHGIAIDAIRSAYHGGLRRKDRCGRTLGAHEKRSTPEIADDSQHKK